jgi:osmotically-inducible protein OsmY
MNSRTTPWPLLVGACAPEPEAEDRTTTGTVSSATADVSQDLKDTWVTTKIQAKYFADGDVKGRNIDVTTSDGVVTLAGVVEDERARRQAVALARATDDVVRVDDRLTAKAASEPAAAPSVARQTRPDEAVARDADFEDRVSNAWVATKIQSRYFLDAIVKGRNIDVTSNNGVVTLEGRVASPTERDHALQLARNTDGVRRVDDRLVIESQTTEARAVAPAVSDPMAEPPRAPVAPVPPAVPPDDAGFSDTPPRPVTPTTPPAVGEPTTSGAGDTERMTDAGITTRIQSKYFLDDLVKPRDIAVVTRDGVVTLSGQVDSESQKQRAISVARSVHGVVDVEEQLRVASPGAATIAGRQWGVPEGASDDTWITTQIQSKFYTDAFVKVGDVEVITQAGAVTLTGTVPSAEGKRRAEMIARDTAGVQQVRNQLSVEPNAMAEPDAGNTMPKSKPGPPSGAS